MNTLSPDLTRQQIQQSYTDLNQLQSIRQLGNEDKDAALREVSKQFESFFTQILLKSMRSANEVFGEGSLFDSSEMNFYQDMYDNQLSISLSQNDGLGLSEVLYQQLKGQYINQQSSTGELDNTVENLSTINTNPYRLPIETLQQRQQDQTQISQIETPDDFIEFITPYAKNVANKMGIDYRVLVSQTALETGWGRHVLNDSEGSSSFNFFNIKADSRWEGKSVSVPTIEYVNGVPQQEIANFRRYNTIIESFEDYFQFLEQPRYQHAMKQVDDPKAFVEALQQAGYATDPQYAQKIHRIMNDYLIDNTEGKEQS